MYACVLYVHTYVCIVYECCMYVYCIYPVYMHVVCMLYVHTYVYAYSLYTTCMNVHVFW